MNDTPNYGRTPGKTRLPDWASVGREVRLIRNNAAYVVVAPDYLGYIKATDAAGVEQLVHLSGLNPNGVPKNVR